MKHLIIYHASDLDGKCSAAIVRLYLDRFCRDVEYQFMPMNHGWEIRWDEMKGYDRIWMLDFSFADFNDVVRLQSMTKSLVLIDHHKTTIERREKLGNPAFEGMLDVRHAGCELTWLWLAGSGADWSGDLPNLGTMPYFVRLIGRYDVWDHEDPNVLPFQFGLRLDQCMPEDDIWDRLLDGDIGDTAGEVVLEVVDRGQTVLKFLDNEDRLRARTAKYLDLEGHTAVAVNGAGLNSKRFSYCDPVAICIAYSYNGDHDFWSVTLYSKVVDVSEIAKKYGGGGHKGAAGFQAGTDLMIGLGIFSAEKPRGA